MSVLSMSVLGIPRKTKRPQQHLNELRSPLSMSVSPHLKTQRMELQCVNIGASQAFQLKLHRRPAAAPVASGWLPHLGVPNGRTLAVSTLPRGASTIRLVF